MNNKLEKSCPFCGEEGTEKYNSYTSVVHKKDCLFYMEEDAGLTTYDTSLWQSRPIEDNLLTALDATKSSRNWNYSEVLKLRKKLEIATRTLDDLHIVMFGRITVTYNDMINWHLMIKQTIDEIERIK